MSNATAETIPSDADEPIAEDQQLSVLERFLKRSGDDALERIEKMTAFLARLRILSIQQSYPGDWIIHTSTDAEGNVLAERGYLQDIGADRAGKPWGIQIEQPISQREDQPDGTFSYKMLADGYSRVTGERIENQLGARWSGDKFFTRGLKEGEKPDPTDVEKAAYANLHGRVVRALAGLGGVPLDELAKAGLDITKCVRVGYARGAKGGEATGASVGGEKGIGVVLNFGKSKGKHASEISDKDLKWYTDALTENVNDPSKVQYRDRNQRLLDGLLAEQERRKNPPPAPQQATEPSSGGGPSSLTRGQRCSAIFKRLHGFSAPSSQMLRAIIGKDSLSDASEEELAKLEALPDSELDATASAIESGQERE